MHICNSSVIVTGVISSLDDITPSHGARASTIEALKQLSERLSQLPDEKIDRAFDQLQPRR